VHRQYMSWKQLNYVFNTTEDEIEFYEKQSYQ